MSYPQRIFRYALEPPTCEFCLADLHVEDGVWVDETEGDACSGDDNLVNENEPHRPLVIEADFRWEICRRCKGEGELRGWAGAFTESDRAEWSEEDYEDYAETRRACKDCSGAGKVRVLRDEAAERPRVREWIKDYYETESIYRMERRMGA